MIVREVARENSSQMGVVEYDDMGETLSADTADQAFNVRILPWRSWRRDDFFDTHVPDALAEVRGVDSVSVSDQEARRFVVRKGFDDLLGCPERIWMGRDVEVDDNAAVVSEHDEAEQYAERRCQHREEVDGDDVSDMIVKESTPSL